MNSFYQMTKFYTWHKMEVIADETVHVNQLNVIKFVCEMVENIEKGSGAKEPPFLFSPVS